MAYTFGDNAVAAERLHLLGRVFGPSSRMFVAEAGRRGLDLVADLGCGTGATTRLLHDLLRPRRLVGLDAAEDFLTEARALLPTAEFHQADLTGPLPLDGIDLAYARFLVSHLAEPEERCREWACALRPGTGLLLLEEVERIDADLPPLRDYVAATHALVAAQGAELWAGARLDRLAAGWPGARSTAVTVEPRTGEAARMFGLNLRTWRHGAWARANLPAPDADRLEEALAALDGRALRGEIRWTMRRVVLPAEG